MFIRSGASSEQSQSSGIEIRLFCSFNKSHGSRKGFCASKTGAATKGATENCIGIAG